MEQQTNWPHDPTQQPHDPRTAPGAAPGSPPGYQPPGAQWPPRDLSNLGAAAFNPHGKSPALACFLSLMPGLGQIYVGYYQRGFVHALSFAGLIAVLATLSDREFTPLAPMTGVFMVFFYLYNIIDAGRRAALYNQALRGGASIPLPSDMEQAGMRGSLAGGALLVGAGLLMLLHTRFDMTLTWVEDWWPVAPILIGVWLIYKNLESQKEAAARKER
jgi:hypothetical protein